MKKRKLTEIEKQMVKEVSKLNSLCLIEFRIDYIYCRLDYYIKFGASRFQARYPNNFFTFSEMNFYFDLLVARKELLLSNRIKEEKNYKKKGLV